MGPLDLFFHFSGFVAPAVFLGLLVALGARLVLPRQQAAGRWWALAGVNSLVGTAVLAAGLWHYGVDGKMTTYAALVLAVASSQWLCSRAWRG